MGPQQQQQQQQQPQPPQQQPPGQPPGQEQQAPMGPQQQQQQQEQPPVQQQQEQPEQPPEPQFWGVGVPMDLTRYGWVCSGLTFLTRFDLDLRSSRRGRSRSMMWTKYKFRCAEGEVRGR